MRIVQSEEENKLWEEVKPYLNTSLDGVSFKDNTPNEIKDKFKKWQVMSREAYDKAVELL